MLAELYSINKESINRFKEIEISALVLLIFFNSITLVFTYHGNELTNDLKKMDYYNYFNDIYVRWYDDMPPRFINAKKRRDWKNLNINNLNNKEGAFSHPPNFQKELEEKLEKCSNDKKLKKCINYKKGTCYSDS